MDLQPNRQKKVATNLLLALEENAFLLAGVIDEPTNILETQEIMSKFHKNFVTHVLLSWAKIRLLQKSLRPGLCMVQKTLSLVQC